MSKIDELKKRLESYPGPHENEQWKKETDLNRCTRRERREMKRYGLTVGDFMKAGLNRGEVSHILFGYRFSPRRTG